MPKNPTWARLCKKPPLLLPAAHDALTAKLIEKAGFRAYQIGGFALAAARHALPDVGLDDFGDTRPAVSDIMAASKLPVMVDCDTGGDDAKSVVRMVHRYEQMGVSAIFLEDQQMPKRCGHMANKKILPPDIYRRKLRAALDARHSDDFFIMARTDAYAIEGLKGALRRGEAYVKEGADGLFIDGVETIVDLGAIGSSFDVPLAANMFEGGGKTPIVTADALKKMGFAMVLYPTSLVFRVAKTLETALRAMLEQRLDEAGPIMSFDHFEDMIDLPGWKKIERTGGEDVPDVG
ncbi:MAG TPA: isocitrate lyase/PEP mutase family protein [Isosphaeraceae bacterium]